MKTATIPALRVAPGLRKAAESVLENGETLSGFVEQSLRSNIGRRRAQRQFIARGLASADKARRTGRYVSTDAVLEELDRMLARSGRPKARR